MNSMTERTNNQRRTKKDRRTNAIGRSNYASEERKNPNSYYK